MVCGRYLDNNNFIGRIPEGLYRHPFLKELYVGSRIPIYMLLPERFPVYLYCTVRLLKHVCAIAAGTSKETTSGQEPDQKERTHKVLELPDADILV